MKESTEQATQSKAIENLTYNRSSSVENHRLNKRHQIPTFGAAIQDSLPQAILLVSGRPNHQVMLSSSRPHSLCVAFCAPNFIVRFIIGHTLQLAGLEEKARKVKVFAMKI